MFQKFVQFSVALSFIGGALVGVTAPSLAETVTAATKIDAVTVYPSGAQVMRTGTVRVPAGAHVIRVADLPDDIMSETLRVEADASAGMEIGAVDLKRIFLTEDERGAQLAVERKTIEDEIERLERMVTRLGHEIRVKETQRDFLINLAGLPTRTPAGGRDTGGAPTDWAGLFTLIGTNMSEVQTAIFQLRERVKATERDIADERRKLARLGAQPRQQLVGDVEVTAEADADVQLTIRYQVRSASWTPLYDVRLDTGDAEKPAGLALTRRAAIQQRTGETWADVALSLSTVRPTGTTAAPELRPLVVDIRPPEPTARPLAAPPLAQGVPRDAVEADRDGGARSFRGRSGLRARRPAALVTAKQRAASVSASAFQATYAVPGRTTVGDDGTLKQVKIDVQTVEPKLTVLTVPRREPRAYLTAEFKLPGEAPYLAGRANLFRDGTYVGEGRLPERASGQDLKLGFGVDERVRVRFDVQQDQSSEAGIISSERTEEKRWTITLKNLHKRQMAVTVVDRIPVARDEKIKVVPASSIPPNIRDLEKKRGVLAWQFDMKADTEQTLEVGYRVTWPSGENVVYR